MNGACHITVFLAIAILSLGSTSCSKTPKWFLGTYEFDALESLKPLMGKPVDPEAKKMKKDENKVDAMKGLLNVFAPIALAKAFEGATLTITDGEIVTTKAGTGTVVRFEVYQIPDANTVVLKTSENKIETWIRTATGIAQKASGDIDLLVPFKRK